MINDSYHNGFESRNDFRALQRIGNLGPRSITVFRPDGLHIVSRQLYACLSVSATNYTFLSVFSVHCFNPHELRI